MATYTENYNLKKPDPLEFIEVEDFNDNADAIDAALGEIDGKAASGSKVFYGTCSKVTSGKTASADDTNIYTVDIKDRSFEAKEGVTINIFIIGIPVNTKNYVRLSINGKEYALKYSFAYAELGNNPKFFEVGSVVQCTFVSTSNIMITNNMAYLSPYYMVKNAGYTGSVSQFYADLASVLENKVIDASEVSY